MSLKIRLARYGRTHRPFYRVVVIDSRNAREGKAVETVGTYDPLVSDKNVKVDIDRIHHWVGVGAQLSESVRSLLRHNGYQPLPEAVHAVRAKRRLARAANRKAATNKDPKRVTRWTKGADGTKVPVSRRKLEAHRIRQKKARLAELEAAWAAKKVAEEAAAAASAENEAPAAEG